MQERERVLELWWWLRIVLARCENKIEAWEGLRVVRERLTEAEEQLIEDEKIQSLHPEKPNSSLEDLKRALEAAEPVMVDENGRLVSENISQEKKSQKRQMRDKDKHTRS